MAAVESRRMPQSRLPWRTSKSRSASRCTWEFWGADDLLVSDSTAVQSAESSVHAEQVEERFRAVLGTLFGALAIYSPRRDEPGRIVDFRVDYVNEAACASAGLRADEQIGRGLLELYPEYRDNGVFEAYCRVFEAGAPLTPHDFASELVDNGQRSHRVLEIRAARVDEGLIAAWRDVTERARAEAQLRVQAELLDTVEQAVIATDLEGRITYWNRFAERLYGWSEAEVLGRTVQDVTPAQVSRDQAESIMTRLRAGESWAGEFLVQRRDGSLFPALVTDTPIRDRDGSLVGVVGVSSDLTERKRMEHELAAALEREQAASRRATESLALLDVLVSSAPVGIVFFDRELRYVRVNQELADMNGLPIELHLGCTVREITPDIADAAEPVLRRVLETGEPVRDLLLTGETPRQPGVMRAWRESYYPIRGADGRIVGVGVIALEVTDQHRLEAERERLLANERAARAEAEAQRTRLREVLDVLPEGVLIADRATQTFVLNNRASVSLIGADLVGQSVPSGSEPAYGSRRFDGTLIPADDLPLQRAFRGESVTGAQYFHHQLAENRDVPVLVNGAPLHDATGGIVAALCVFQDITAIHDLDQQKDAFLATVSHDLQQPLAVIKGRAQLLRRRLARGGTVDPVRVNGTLAAIQATVDDMAGQLAELLDATRLQMGRPLELQRTTIDMVPFLHEIVANWDEVSPGHGVHLETTLASLEGSFDAPRLRRVFANLLSNAVKYSPSGGGITLRLGREKDAQGRVVAVVEVQDHGVGIPAADVARIFERFYRARNAGQAASGAGIGLSGARQIVDQHGGTIRVESVEGVGSTFIVRLPV